jgi:hypothetical protein
MLRDIRAAALGAVVIEAAPLPSPFNIVLRSVD